jgi:proline dehydrogenase
MISFENTEIAFAGKTDKDLKRAHRLFKLVAHPSLVKIGGKFTHFAFAVHLPIKSLIKKTIFRQFCGGENIEECDVVIEQLYKYGVGTILDYSIEGKEGETFFEQTADEIIRTIEKAGNNPKIPFAVFKLTGIARFDLLEKANLSIEKLSEIEKAEYEKVLKRVERICSKAHLLSVPLFVDAEDFCIQSTIDRITHAMMEKYNSESAIVYNTVQMYRHDRIHFLTEELKEAKAKGYHYGVKIVRGAYMEKERARAKEKGYTSPIQKDKISSDKDYNAALELCIKSIDFCAICAGTHNEESTHFLIQLMEKYAIEKSNKKVYFAQLLGMSDHISFNLGNEKYRVVKYVPYGPLEDVMPYLLRRAEENTSVAGQTGRELGLIQKEMKRRKLS